MFDVLSQIFAACWQEHGPAWSEPNKTVPLLIQLPCRWKEMFAVEAEGEDSVTVYFKQTTLIHAMLRYGFWHALNTFRRVALTVGSGSLLISSYFYQFCIALTNIHCLYYILFAFYRLGQFYWPSFAALSCKVTKKIQKGWWLDWRFRSRKACARGDIWKHLETAKILGTEIQSLQSADMRRHTRNRKEDAKDLGCQSREVFGENQKDRHDCIAAWLLSAD